jgi:hypothetical protein
MSSINTVVATGVTSEKLVNVRKWNVALTILHLGQAIAMLLLTNDFALKVLSSFPAGWLGNWSIPRISWFRSFANIDICAQDV